MSAIEGWDVIVKAQELAAAGEDFALATVVWRQAPSSGKQGSRAIVTASGELHGWIGGACSEPIVIREAKEVIAQHEPKLLLLATDDSLGAGLPEGMAVTPMHCQSEGALQVYIEPVIPTPSVVVVGRSPMAQTLADLTAALGWQVRLVPGETFAAADIEPRSVVVIATQGHGDEDAVRTALEAYPAYVGLVVSRKRGAAVAEYLRDRGVLPEAVDRLHYPVGIDLGHTTHREIAVAVLAELVQRRAAGELVARPRVPDHVQERSTLPMASAPDAVDPVCGMTVAATGSSYPFEHEGQTYYFCCAGCRTRFEKNPAGYVTSAKG